MLLIGPTLALTAVLGLLLAAIWLLRGRVPLSIKAPWRPHQEGPPELRRLAGLALTAQHTIHVIEWRGRGLLLATGPGGTVMLERDTAAKSFAQEYRRAVIAPPAGLEGTSS
jgi:hypothetical protein